MHEYLASIDFGAGFEAISLWPEPGERFAGFELLEQIGSGAFARVFLAKQTGVGDREVVVKVTALAEREARLLGRLMHDNIVKVHTADYDPETGLSAICMEYRGRATLSHVLARAHHDQTAPIPAELPHTNGLF